MYWITEHLGVSGFYDARFEPPVTAVLNVAEQRPYEPPPRMTYLHLGFPDVQPFPIPTGWTCVRWLDDQVDQGHRVLVHCAEGNSRSVSVVMAYLLHKGRPLPELKRLVLSRKPFASSGGNPTDLPQYFQDAFLAAWIDHLKRRR